MSDETLNTSELDTLKAQADKMGIKYGDNIGVDTLRKRIADQLQGAVVSDPVQKPVEKSSESPVQDVLTQARLEATKLLRVRVVPMDSTKRDYQGEIFSAGNSAIPTVRRFIPFNEPTHIENILYQQLKDKEYQYFVSKKLPTGETIRQAKIGKTYNIEVLDHLTEEEFEELKKSQLVRSATD